MDNNEVQLVGGPCGHHGPYTFYKAFKYTKNGVKRIMTLSEFFFVKLWIDSDLVCIGELQLLWIDKNSEQVLASLRLYFLPENTPEGRMDHGEDEVLAISEKVVLRVEDLITWITVDAEWTWGRLAKCEAEVKEPKEEKDTIASLTFKDGQLDFTNVEKERKPLDGKCEKGPSVVILSYPRYCRYRAMIKRLEGVEQDYLKFELVTALGGFTVTSKNTRVLFCRDTFDYPDLEGHELLCNHLAPKLKGRPRGKRKKRSVSPGSESNESESSGSNVPSNNKPKITTEGGRNGLRCDTTTSPRRSTRSTENSESKTFLKKLYAFMKSNRTPIGRIPQCGYKELDLFAFYTKVQKLGGYDVVVTSRLWKSIFDDLSGNHNSTSAATVIRRHYERFLLPYERHSKGEEYKPMSVSERRRLKSKNHSTSDAETSESTSESGKSTPVAQQGCSSSTPSTPVDNKDFNIHMKTEGKTSSLRSVRVKSERLREGSIQKDKTSSASDKSPSDNESKVKTELSDEYCIDMPSSSKANNNMPEKNCEPVTSAVAPVMQKIIPEKSLSPAECKDDIAVMTTEEAANTSNDQLQDSVAEGSYESKTLDSTGHNPYKEANINPSIMQEVKKRKLDILKEGGLEVTPVTSFPALSAIKDIRPSVIQQAAAPMHVTARSMIPDKRHMPPPSSLPSKRQVQLQNNIPQIPLVPSLQNLSKQTSKPGTFEYTNDQSPPKVVQSRSIYSYSEKTIYGNPKDLAVPSSTRVHSPRFAGVRQTGGDILDLRMTSPQKPVVEIMRIPSVTTAPSVPLNLKDKQPRGSNKKQPTMPFIEGKKIGSNLEITLVGPQNNKSPYSVHNQLNKYSYNAIPNSNYSAKKLGNKRTYSESYAYNKFSRFEENGRSPRSSSSSSYTPSKDVKGGSLEITVPNPYMKNQVSKQDSTSCQPKSVTYTLPSTNSKQPSNAVPPVFPNYLPLLSSANKNVSPYLPIIDPIYYSALQSMYPSNTLPPAAPLFPMPTPEQLQIYTELMAQSARARYPFPFPDSANTTPENSNLKKL